MASFAACLTPSAVHSSNVRAILVLVTYFFPGQAAGAHYLPMVVSSLDIPPYLPLQCCVPGIIATPLPLRPLSHAPRSLLSLPTAYLLHIPVPVSSKCLSQSTSPHPLLSLILPSPWLSNQVIRQQEIRNSLLDLILMSTIRTHQPALANLRLQ